MGLVFFRSRSDGYCRLCRFQHNGDFRRNGCDGCHRAYWCLHHGPYRSDGAGGANWRFWNWANWTYRSSGCYGPNGPSGWCREYGCNGPNRTNGAGRTNRRLKRACGADRADWIGRYHWTDWTDGTGRTYGCKQWSSRSYRSNRHARCDRPNGDSWECR